MNIVTRKEAIQRGLGEYFTGVPCRNGHTTKRYTRSAVCYECLHPSINAPGKAQRQARLAARRRMIVNKFRIADAQLPVFMAQAYGLALSYEPSLEMSDLETRGKIHRLCSWAAIYPVRIFPEMLVYLRPLELQSWGTPIISVVRTAEYWPEGDPR